MNKITALFTWTASIAVVMTIGGVAKADSIDLTQFLKSQGADDIALSLCFGNSCNGWLAEGRYDWNPADPSAQGSLYAEFRLHNKHRHCVPKPWPLSGEVCYDVYNYWATIHVYADLVDCALQNVRVSTASEAYAIPAWLVNHMTSEFNDVLDEHKIPNC